jgi:hypothetical protein
MVWVVSRFRLKFETSSTRSQKSINSDGTHEISLEGTSSRKGVYKLDSQTASTSAHRIPSTLIADRGGGICGVLELHLQKEVIIILESHFIISLFNMSKYQTIRLLNTRQNITHKRNVFTE